MPLDRFNHSHGALHPHHMVGTSNAMQELRASIAAVAPRDCNVLISGESGTGKELIARQIHASGPRSNQPFIAIDCTTLPDNLFESQLFGHVRGAFTGADRDTLGFLRAADKGTILLDEIGDLSPALQAKFLRFLQERSVIPLGGIRPVPVNVRVLAATHQDLTEKVQNGEFRQDLYYRLHVVNLTVPPLRNRKADLAKLAEYFLECLASRYNETSPKLLSSDAFDALNRYDWPGNIRELANVIEHGYVLSEGNIITEQNLPSAMQMHEPSPLVASTEKILPLEQAEKMLVAQALQASGGHQARAARILQIERRRLYRMVRRHGLESYVRVRSSSTAS